MKSEHKRVKPLEFNQKYYKSNYYIKISNERKYG